MLRFIPSLLAFVRTLEYIREPVDRTSMATFFLDLIRVVVVDRESLYMSMSTVSVPGCPIHAHEYIYHGTRGGGQGLQPLDSKHWRLDVDSNSNSVQFSNRVPGW